MAMGRMTINSVEKKIDETLVSNIFIDNYMKDANGEFVKVYLYLLRCIAGTGCSGLSTTEIADRLNFIENDVIRALKYWDSVKVLSVTFDKESGEPTSLTLLPLKENTDYSVTLKANEADNKEVSAVITGGQPPAKEKDSAREAVKASRPVAKASYSAAQIKTLKEKEEVKQLLYIAESYLKKTLTASEINTIFYLQEGLGFSSDLIDYLIEYCANNDHSNMKYIEKVALAWHENGITTVEQAKSATAMCSKHALTVSKHFGIGDRKFTPAELDMIKRWSDEYNFSDELIAEACKRTVLNMGKPNFSYAEGIFKKWKVKIFNLIIER